MGFFYNTHVDALQNAHISHIPERYENLPSPNRRQPSAVWLASNVLGVTLTLVRPFGIK